MPPKRANRRYHSDFQEVVASERSDDERPARNRLRAWGPAAAWAAVLFLLSAWSTPPVPSWMVGMDKPAHVALYTILGGTLGYGRYHAIPAPPHWLLIGIGALYGATDEWHQGFVRDRSPDWGDWLADLGGVSLGYVAVLLLLMRLARRKQPRVRGSDVSE